MVFLKKKLCFTFGTCQNTVWYRDSKGTRNLLKSMYRPSKYHLEIPRNHIYNFGEKNKSIQTCFSTTETPTNRLTDQFFIAAPPSRSTRCPTPPSVPLGRALIAEGFVVWEKTDVPQPSVKVVSFFAVLGKRASNRHACLLMFFFFFLGRKKKGLGSIWLKIGYLVENLMLEAWVLEVF